MTKRYYSVGGEIIGERSGAVRRDYLRDALGSVTSTKVTSETTLQNTYRYKPYGERLAKTGGAPDPRFQYVGTAGYRHTPISHSASYIRGRHLGLEEGRWTTDDPIWLLKSSFDYCFSRPSMLTDPSGLDPIGLELNLFIGKHLGAWIAEPPSTNWAGGLRYEFKGDNRSFGESGTSRVGTHFTLDSCVIGSSGRFKNNTGLSHRRVAGGDGTIYTKPAFNWINIKKSHGAGKCITYFHGEVKSAYPFVRPMFAPTTISLQGYFMVSGKNQVSVNGLIKHSPFPDAELIGHIGSVKTILYKKTTPFATLMLVLPVLVEKKFSYFLKVPTDCCCSETPCCIGECPCSD